MEEIVPTKIDWKKFKKLFPAESSGWELPLKAKFPDRDLSGFHESYAAAMDAMYAKLPSSSRKALGLFVAATTINAIECVDFQGCEIDCEYDPEEWMDTALPHLNPRQMKQIAKALETIKANDYRGAIVKAWDDAKVKDDAGVTVRLPAAKDFVAYLEHWIAAFSEIHSDGAVLGIVTA